MAHSKRKPRKGSPSKTRHGKEKKQLRKRLDREREEQREQQYQPTYDQRHLSNAEHYGVEPEDLGECLRCCAPWPSGMKNCPECGWDGISLAFMLPMAMPRIYS